MRALKDIFIAVVLAVVILFLLGIFYKTEPQIQVLDREVVKTDTLVIVDYIEKDPVYIEKEVIVRDTIYVNTAGDSSTTEVAPLDTTFGTGDRLSVLYYIKPKVYEVEFTPAQDTIQTINVTSLEYVYVDSSLWWDKFKWGATSGVVATALLTFLVK